MHICFFSAHEWAIPEDGLQAGMHRVSKMTGDLSSVVSRLNEKDPDVIFLNGFEPDGAFLDALQSLSDLLPSAVLIPVIKSPKPEFLLQAMRFGVREVLSSESAEEVLQVISRLSTTTSSQKKSRSEKKMARRVGFMSAKGGDGGSFISANLSYALAENPNTRALLVDLAIPFGDVEMYLTSEAPSNDLADITNEIDRLDQALLTSMVHHLSDQLDFIPSPRSFEKIINLQPNQIERLIDLSASNYDFLIVDMGTGFDPITLRTIEKIDQLFIVVTQSVPSIRRAGQIMRLLETIGINMAKVSVVVNKFAAKEPIGLTDIENALKKAIGLKFSVDAEGVRESIVKGAPYLSLFPKSDLTRAITELSGDWLGKPKEDKSVWRRFGIK
jgi:pilus assembly protein CpaE